MLLKSIKWSVRHRVSGAFWLEVTPVIKLLYQRPGRYQPNHPAPQSPEYIMRLSKNKHINVKFLVRALTDMV